MARHLPFYRMWVKDFDTNEAVKMLSLPEVGLFILCLNHAWVNDGLPLVGEDIARALKIPAKEFSRHWVRVKACFFSDGQGRLRNKRQEEERTEAIERSRQATEAVRIREERRIARSSSDTSGDHPRRDHIRASESDSVCGISSEKLNPEVKSSTRAEDFIGMWIRAGFDSPEGFESWYQILYAEHPTRGEFEIGKRLIVQEIISGTIRRSDFEEGYAAHRNSPQWKRDKGRYIPKLSIFCRDRGWKFPPVAGNGNAADGKEHY